jgi:hypothetical protein
VINVQVLRNLTDEQRELLERLGATISESNLREDGSVRAKLRRWLNDHAA